MAAFMKLIHETQDSMGYLDEYNDQPLLPRGPLRELDAMMHLPGYDVEVVASGAFTLEELYEEEDGNESSDSSDQTDDIIGDGNPHRLFSEREPVIMSETALLFRGSNYGSDRNGKCQIIFDFYEETDAGEVGYEATIGDLWSLDEVIEDETEWTDVIGRINSQVLPMADNPVFLAADLSMQQSILREQCFDARQELTGLIDTAAPVVIECLQYFEINHRSEMLGGRIDQSEKSIEEQISVEGVIEDIIYPELMNGLRQEPLRKLDDFNYGDGAPCLLVRGMVVGSDIYYLVPTHVIRSIDRQYS